MTNGLHTMVPRTPSADTDEDETEPTDEIISRKIGHTNLGMDHVHDLHPKVDAAVQDGLLASHKTRVLSPLRNMVRFYICVTINLLNDSARYSHFVPVFCVLLYSAV